LHLLQSFAKIKITPPDLFYRTASDGAAIYTFHDNLSFPLRIYGTSVCLSVILAGFLFAYLFLFLLLFLSSPGKIRLILFFSFILHYTPISS